MAFYSHEKTVSRYIALKKKTPCDLSLKSVLLIIIFILHFNSLMNFESSQKWRYPGTSAALFSASQEERATTRRSDKASQQVPFYLSHIETVINK